jgi:hypothetical protein
MQGKPRFFLTVLLATALIWLAACSSQPAQREGQQDANNVYPPGVRAFPDAAAAIQSGLYPGKDASTCCFLKPVAHITLTVPPGKKRAIFTFYVPNVVTYSGGESVTISAGGKKTVGSSQRSNPRLIQTRVDLPKTRAVSRVVPVDLVAGKSYVPKALGINADNRRLSVMLISVRYE